MALAAIHPGEHLTEEMQALDMSADELARKINVPTNRVTQILNGTRSITGDTALRLAHFFGTSAQFWLNLQSLYDLRRAQRKAGKSIKSLPTLKRRELVRAWKTRICHRDWEPVAARVPMPVTHLLFNKLLANNIEFVREVHTGCLIFA
jgi:antitoxin HigA-1